MTTHDVHRQYTDAHSSYQVNESKKLCAETTRCVGQTKEMIDTSTQDQETIASVRPEVEALKQQREATDAHQAQSSTALATTVEALQLELAVLRN